MAPNFRLIWQEAFSLFSPVMLLLLSGVAVNGAEYDATAKPATIPLEVGVDQRVELISIIFRLAGNPEYRQGRLKGYLQDIEKHFEPARAHPVIALAKQLRAKRGVSFDAPMSLAVHLKDAESLAERVPFAPHPVGLDNRWQLAEVREFLVQARDFVQVAKFGEFCQAQQPLYEETAARARRLLITEGRLEWFNEFFGARPGARFRMAPALVNGGSCYGARVQLDKEEELYCILGVWRTDTGDKPVFDREVLDTVAHEFCHSYVNPHVYARAKELEAAGKKLFAQVQERMRRMAYGNWQTMMHESVVRAAVVRYLDATQGRLAATKQVWEESQRGFWWMKELALLLEDYEAHRDKYPQFDKFMPRIVEFFDEYAKKPASQPVQPAANLPKSDFPLKRLEAGQVQGAAKNLAHDDGQAAGRRSLGGNGHAVRFAAPDANWFLTAVEIHGSRYGARNPPAEDFHVWLCDADFKVIADFPFPYARFTPGAEQWVKLEVKPTQVPARFMLGVGFNPTARKGVYVSYDAAASGDSLAGLPGQTALAFTNGDWLIRAVIAQENR